MRYWLLAILSTLSFSPAFAAQTQQTDVLLYRPFEQAQASKVVDGSCWTASIADPRPDAWRCMVGNAIHDPCFVKTYVQKDHLICPKAPWSRQAIAIKLTNKLPSHGNQPLDMSKAMPWSIQLANGAKCQLMTGATGLIDGKRANYACDNQAYLVGRIQRCKTMWQVLYKAPHATTLQKMGVQKVWF